MIYVTLLLVIYVTLVLLLLFLSRGALSSRSLSILCVPLNKGGTTTTLALFDVQRQYALSLALELAEWLYSWASRRPQSPLAQKINHDAKYYYSLRYSP